MGGSTLPAAPEAAPAGAAAAALEAPVAPEDASFSLIASNGDDRLEGSELQPASAARAMTVRNLLADRIDDSFDAFDLAVAHGAQLAQRLEAGLDPLVVHADRGAARVDLVELGGLLLEREGL